MNISDRIAGFSTTGTDIDAFGLHLVRETQAVKVHQSHVVLPFIVIGAIIYLISLWDDAPRFQLSAWVSLIVAAAILRTVICHRIEKRLADADLRELHSNEVWLFNTSLLSTSIVGSGFWWICIDGTDRAVFAVTLLCCMYAIATTINSSVRFHNFWVLILANLGQGIVFLSGVGRSPDLEVSFALITITAILVAFGRKNSDIFAETLHAREEIRKQNLKLEQANKDKSHFLAAASHDLAQPLHAMGLNLGRLKKKITDTGLLEIVDDIDEANGILTDQYNGLVELSRLDLGTVEPYYTTFRLDKLLDRLVNGVAADAAEKNLRLELKTEPASVTTDKKRIESSIRNIVLNAIRYTESGSVTIATRGEANGLHITISDTGPGIAEAEQERIFDVFYQTDNPARSPGEGTGYGLAIVKKNAELLDLEISLDSRLGEGTSFDVFIPARDAPAQRSEEAVRTTRAPLEDLAFEGLNILVIDDDPKIRKALSGLIEDWRCTPYTAASTAEARAVLEGQTAIDFAIVDDMLGKNESGLELAEYLATRIPNQPIIVTGNVLIKRKHEIEDHGFQVLEKPLDDEALRQAIASRTGRFTTRSSAAS